MNWRVHIVQNGFDRPGPQLRFGRDVDDRFEEVINFEMESVHISQTRAPMDPPLSGTDAVLFLQAMMDAAYDYGLRPSAAQDERHQKAHLKDMRDITRHLLKMENKGEKS